MKHMVKLNTTPPRVVLVDAKRWAELTKPKRG